MIKKSVLAADWNQTVLSYALITDVTNHKSR